MARKKDMNGDDAILWEKITRQTQPLAKRHKTRQIATNAKTNLKSKPVAQAASKAAAPPRAILTRVPKLPAGILPDLDIELKSRRRLGKGKLEIEARLDLHGMTAAKAQARLTAFVENSVAQRMMWVLVITGKGVAGHGVLRREFPHWCSAAPLSDHIVSFGSASPAHGGDGAFYMRLRKPRG